MALAVHRRQAIGLPLCHPLTAISLAPALTAA
jgi:hypothetical protein